VAVDELENYRVELTGFCNRMLGQPDGEDAVQETFIRAARSFHQFARRGSLRSWLYTIARNVCLDMLEARKRRALPIDLGPASEPSVDNVSTLPRAWTDTGPGIRLAPEGDPADVAETRERVRLAIVTALRHLPPRQRAVLILCEVLCWKASEAAELLETSVASVTSALQRARATLAANDLRAELPISAGNVDSELLARYAEAFESYDLEALIELIRADGPGRRQNGSEHTRGRWTPGLAGVTAQRCAGSATPRAAKRRR
jgi:RNA polymerase sigma-70 factor, ECF subfamily